MKKTLCILAEIGTSDDGVQKHGRWSVCQEPKKEGTALGWVGTLEQH